MSAQANICIGLRAAAQTSRDMSALEEAAMLYHLAANLVLILHLTFVGFVLFGALLVLRWPRLIWLHVPAVAWGALTELAGIVCPLTPLEVRLRELGGIAGYEGGFIEHYVTAILYPSILTRDLQIWLGCAALLPSVLIYGYVLVRWRRKCGTTVAPQRLQEPGERG
jgi:Protein of Unknown function (DUF2784)